jgi:hypothetical protein
MPVIIPQSPARQQLRNNAWGVLDMPFPSPVYAAAGGALTSQTLWGNLVGLRGGDIVSGFVMPSQTAAAGTPPTSLLCVVQNSTGLVLFTVETKNNATWTTAVGAVTMKLISWGSSYTIPSDGGYYCSVWCNGTWGTTQYQTATISSTQQIGEIGTGPPMLISPSGLASVSVNDTPALTRATTSAKVILPAGTPVI